MKTVFMGSPPSSIPVLEALVALGAEVTGVYTQPDRPSGRGRATRPPALKVFALERGMEVFQPVTLRREAVQRELASLEPDLIVVAAYGKILPREVLSAPGYGCINVHPSLLPRHRGPSPVATAILEGDAVTGTSIMILDEGMDTGAILSAREVPMGPSDTTESLTPRLFQLGGEMLAELLPAWMEGRLSPRPQDDSRATITRKLEKGDGEARWELPAVELHRRLRAYTPWPGLFTHWRGRLLKVLGAMPEGCYGTGDPGKPGEVLVLDGGKGLGIATGSGVLRLESLQLEGRRPSTAAEFVRGYGDFPGSRLPS